MPSVRSIVVPFAAGVAVGVILHKYWPQIRESGGPPLDRALSRGSRLFDRARAAFWEQSEKFSDLVAEIREEEELASRNGPPKGDPDPSPPAP